MPPPQHGIIRSLPCAQTVFVLPFHPPTLLSLQGAGCLGADTLLAMLKNYTRNAGIKTSITVGVVGLPNVGKSSLINSLKRARVAQVGNTPGVTKSVQEVHLDKNIKLLDSPGVVFADAESEAAGALRNAVKIERLQDPRGCSVWVVGGEGQLARYSACTGGQ